MSSWLRYSYMLHVLVRASLTTSKVSLAAVAAPAAPGTGCNFVVVPVGSGIGTGIRGALHVQFTARQAPVDDGLLPDAGLQEALRGVHRLTQGQGHQCRL